jgi:DNA-binding NtrC family response regulator
MSRRILVADDEPNLRKVLGSLLRREGYEVLEARDGEEALALLAQCHTDGREVACLITDLRMPRLDGMTLFRRALADSPDLKVIIWTAYGRITESVEAVKHGAFDYIEKGADQEYILQVVRKAMSSFELDQKAPRPNINLHSVPSGLGRFGLIGKASALEQCFQLIEKVADTPSTVLITGESGTGKELVARALHERGPRKGGPFVAVNVAAMPASLLESELFGHVRGAFTDAKRSRDGLLVQASGGTLFLDEIGDMPLEMQVKLLRVLQDRKVRPVGGDEEQGWDARVVCATHRDLDAMVEEGGFRSDLYYRINVVNVGLPPLRSRGADVLLLAQRFLERAAVRSSKAVTGISSPAARKLLDYDWPGNVRELENCVERAVALTRLSEIGVDDLPERVREHKSDRMVIDSADPEELVPLVEVERRYVRKVLLACQGNKTQAARVLGLDRRTLYRRLESLGVKE